MKYIAILVLTSLALIGCSDYSSQVDADYEEWRETQLELAMDSITSTIKPDTVTISHIDTVKKTITKVDTVKKTIRDTVMLTKTKYDTIMVNKTVTKVDTLVTRDTTTIVKTVRDTVIIPQIDTLVTNDTVVVKDTVVKIHTISSDQEILRDTSISLSLEQDGATITRIFHGKVANGVFYDTTLYEYGITCGWMCNANGYCFVNTSSSVYHTISVYPNESFRCTASAYYAIGANGGGVGNMISKCGLTTNIKEAFVNKQYANYFPGWRMVYEKDIRNLGNEIEQLIPPDSSIFLSVSYASHSNTQYCYGPDCTSKSNDNTYVANVATQYGITTKEKPTRYMCAYDLESTN